ncbi:hypothetical protein SUGI_0011400 [Cryptomeria japonica]|uniref:putative leucine-rich repeat receptor-like protein kinase At2g19210 n=1 Tax=Cryptomeria japonica TaxID=3369 RepID=UPI00240897E3|nr:putative leucine-rich repeat receptor-like protein kinase At2g19210 [Cryptomeria japonica]GLJ05110.1 hypothetical protein SUGI_0011400 [Cryptomeria japonica]
MTSNFDRYIGRGGYGPVYVGLLQSKEIIVEVLFDKSHQGPTEFSVEVDMLSRLHHKNSVKFIGYYHEENMIYIYEIMSNGDLRQCLDSQNSFGKCLYWETGVNITLDAGQDLVYLYAGCNPGIIHIDVKSSNILLDGCIEAKVSDFGLSIIGPLDGATRITMLAKGVIGYIDPQYYIHHGLIEKIDIYNFVVVLLEIISG